MADGKVKIDVELTKDKFEQQLKQLDDTGGQVFNKTGTLGKKAGAMIAAGAAAAAVGIGKMATAGLKFNEQMETYTTNFRVMLGSQEEAVKRVNYLKDLAAKTPFELTDLADATQTLLAFQVPANETNKILNQLGDIAMGNKEKLSSLALVFGQVSSAGRLTGQDLLQFVNVGFNPLNYIAKRTGESMEELRDRMSKGAIGVDEVKQAFVDATSEGGQFFNGMEEGSKTFAGRIATLKDNFNELLGNATKPLFNFLSQDALPTAISLVETLNDNLTIVLSTLGGMSAAVGTAFAVKKIQTMTTFVGLLTGQIKIATVATTLWSKAMAFLSANKFVLIAAAIVGIATALGIAASQAGGFGKLFDGIADKIVSIADKAGEFITEFAKSAAENAPEILEALTVALSDGLPALAESGVQILQTLIDSFSKNLPMLIEMGVQIITGLIDSFTANMPLLIDGALTIITGLIMGISQNLPKLIGAAIQLITALIQGISQALPILIQAAPQIIMSLISGIIKALPILIKSAPQIILALIKGILGALSSLLSAGAQMLNAVKQGIIKGLSGLASIGRNIIDGLWNGIKSGIDRLKNKVTSALEGVKNKIASVFKIGSPSKWMRDFIGKNMMIGWEIGISRNVKRVANAVNNAGKKVQGNALSFSPQSLGVATASQGGGSVVDNRIINQNFYNKQTSPYDAYRKVVRGFAY